MNSEGQRNIPQIPKRLAIIGLPGSGKSTFAMKLGKMMNIEVHHLDKLQFIENKKRNKQEFVLIQQEVVGGNSWIVEGCSITTLEMRFARADTVIYFHFSPLLCVWRIFKRFFFHKQMISDSGCAKIPNLELIQYIWRFEKEKRAGIEELRKKYPHVNFIIFKNSKEVDKYFYNISLLM